MLARYHQALEPPSSPATDGVGVLMGFCVFLGSPAKCPPNQMARYLLLLGEMVPGKQGACVSMTLPG